MPLTFSMVLSTQKSGAIWKRPPIDTTTRMPTRRMIEFFSKTSCFMMRSPSLGRLDAETGRGGDARLLGDVDGLIAADRAPDVVGHDQRANQEEDAADRADHV